MLGWSPNFSLGRRSKLKFGLLKLSGVQGEPCTKKVNILSLSVHIKTDAIPFRDSIRQINDFGTGI